MRSDFFEPNTGAVACQAYGALCEVFAQSISSISTDQVPSASDLAE